MEQGWSTIRCCVPGGMPTLIFTSLPMKRGKISGSDYPVMAGPCVIIADPSALDRDAQNLMMICALYPQVCLRFDARWYTPQGTIPEALMRWALINILGYFRQISEPIGAGDCDMPRRQLSSSP